MNNTVSRFPVKQCIRLGAVQNVTRRCLASKIQDVPTHTGQVLKISIINLITTLKKNKGSRYYCGGLLNLLHNSKHWDKNLETD